MLICLHHTSPCDLFYGGKKQWQRVHSFTQCNCFFFFPPPSIFSFSRCDVCFAVCFSFCLCHFFSTRVIYLLSCVNCIVTKKLTSVLLKKKRGKNVTIFPLHNSIAPWATLVTSGMKKKERKKKLSCFIVKCLIIFSFDDTFYLICWSVYWCLYFFYSSTARCLYRRSIFKSKGNQYFRFLFKYNTQVHCSSRWVLYLHVLFVTSFLVDE